MAEPVRWSGCEPTLSEMLADPIVRALMEADGVEAGEVEAVLRSVAASPLRVGSRNRVHRGYFLG